MSEEKFIGLEKFEYSPVDFLPNMLKNFFDGTIDEATFKKNFNCNVKEAKIILVLMSREDLNTYKKVFRNEFILADKIDAAMNHDKLSGQELKDMLKEFITQYINDDLTEIIF